MRSFPCPVVTLEKRKKFFFSGVLDPCLRTHCFCSKDSPHTAVHNFSPHSPQNLHIPNLITPDRFSVAQPRYGRCREDSSRNSYWGKTVPAENAATRSQRSRGCEMDGPKVSDERWGLAYIQNGLCCLFHHRPTDQQSMNRIGDIYGVMSRATKSVCVCASPGSIINFSYLYPSSNHQTRRAPKLIALLPSDSLRSTGHTEDSLQDWKGGKKRLGVESGGKIGATSQENGAAEKNPYPDDSSLLQATPAFSDPSTSAL